MPAYEAIKKTWTWTQLVNHVARRYVRSQEEQIKAEFPVHAHVQLHVRQTETRDGEENVTNHRPKAFAYGYCILCNQPFTSDSATHCSSQYVCAGCHEKERMAVECARLEQEPEDDIFRPMITDMKARRETEAALRKLANAYRPRGTKNQEPMTNAEFTAKIEQQEGLCAMCHRPFDLRTADTRNAWLAPHNEHNHSTGKNRDVLHMKCNIGFGIFGEDPELLWLAIEYAKKWNTAPDPECTEMDWP